MAQKIALIGAGRMGYNFSKAIRASGREIVAVFDPMPHPYAIKEDPSLAPLHLQDMDQLMHREADAYVICTTADHHVPTAMTLLDGGARRLVIEKPLSQSVLEARKLKARADELGARVIVNHGRRYCANTQELKKLDGSGSTGTLRCITIKTGGGALGCVGTHWIDLCNNLMGGMPDKIFANISQETPANNRGAQFNDPGGTVILFYPNGRRAILDMGDDVGVVVGADFVYEVSVVSWQSEGANWIRRQRLDEDVNKSLSFYGLPLVEHPFVSEAPNLVSYAMSALEDAFTDAPPISGLTEALETMIVYSGIRLSAERDRPITLPLDAEAEEVVYAIP